MQLFNKKQKLDFYMKGKLLTTEEFKNLLSHLASKIEKMAKSMYDNIGKIFNTPWYNFFYNAVSNQYVWCDVLKATIKYQLNDFFQKKLEKNIISFLKQIKPHKGKYYAIYQYILNKNQNRPRMI